MEVWEVGVGDVEGEKGGKITEKLNFVTSNLTSRDDFIEVI